MNKNLLQSSLVIGVFCIAFFGKTTLHQFLPTPQLPPILYMFYSYLWWLTPVFAYVGLSGGFASIPQALGLNKSIFFGLVFALIAVSPMFISSAIIGKVPENIGLLVFLKKTLFAGFMEELLFRGFLFGVLFRKLGWGFIPASILGALIFGMGHLYQGSSPIESAGVFMVTFVGSAWFAWLFIEWEENLWVPIFMHVFMNLSWALFDVSENALGDVFTNVFRLMTISLTVFATIRHGLKKKHFGINAKNLFVNGPRSNP